MTKFWRRAPANKRELTHARVASSSSKKRAHSLASEHKSRTRRRRRNRTATESSTLESSRIRRDREPSTDFGSRKWVYSCLCASTSKDKLVVVCYNVLGVDNASKHPDLYVNVAYKYMEWNRRKELICKEIRRYDADILCLQEVDRFDDLSRAFQKDGFEGIYKGRTGEAQDGCAIFWKEELFTLLHKEDIEFQRFGLFNNVAQLCVLEMKRSDAEMDRHTRSSRRFLIGNTHLLFNPKRGDVKLGQVRLILDKASQLSRVWGDIPIIFSGDLNSTPQSPMYDFLASAKLDYQQYDRRHISGQTEFQSECRAFKSFHGKASSSTSNPFFQRWRREEIILASGDDHATHLQHHLKLRSAYPNVPGSGRTRDNCGEPLATSFHSSFLGTVDYIWHTRELVPVRVLETLPLDVLRRIGGLPSKNWGSDHLALVCELAFPEIK